MWAKHGSIILKQIYNSCRVLKINKYKLTANTSESQVLLTWRSVQLWRCVSLDHSVTAHSQWRVKTASPRTVVWMDHVPSLPAIREPGRQTLETSVIPLIKLDLNYETANKARLSRQILALEAGKHNTPLHLLVCICSPNHQLQIVCFRRLRLPYWQRCMAVWQPCFKRTNKAKIYLDVYRLFRV